MLRAQRKAMAGEDRYKLAPILLLTYHRLSSLTLPDPPSTLRHNPTDGSSGQTLAVEGCTGFAERD